jgi:hypothetical protein
MGGIPPCDPPELIAGRKGLSGGGKGRRGLALDGASWPSGARSSQPSQTIQVAGEEIQRGGAETRREFFLVVEFSASLRLCGCI